MINTNSQNIFFRNAAISLLDVLQSNISVEQVDDDESEHIPVKFMFSAGNNEQFIKDFFSESSIYCNDNKAEGNYESLPFGIIHVLPTFQIQTKDLTNKFVRANYTDEKKDENKKKTMQGFSARLMALPVTITFKVEIRVSTLTQLFKVTESVIDTLYANIVAYFQFRGLRIQSQFRFPDTTEFKKQEQFDFGTADNYMHVSFNVEMETYFPCFDKKTKMNRENVITQFNKNLTEGTSNHTIGDKNGEFIDESFPTIE
jgi:hypothetical protein